MQGGRASSVIVRIELTGLAPYRTGIKSWVKGAEESTSGDRISAELIHG
jgi:hypothetical protein